MEDIKLSVATDYIIYKLMEQHDLTRAQARKLLANVLLRNIVLEEIYKMGDFITGAEDDDKEEAV